MEEGNRKKNKMKKVKAILVLWTNFLKGDVMLIEDEIDHKEEVVEEENLKGFALDVECKAIWNLNG